MPFGTIDRPPDNERYSTNDHIHIHGEGYSSVATVLFPDGLSAAYALTKEGDRWTAHLGTFSGMGTYWITITFPGEQPEQQPKVLTRRFTIS